MVPKLFQDAVLLPQTYTPSPLPPHLEIFFHLVLVSPVTPLFPSPPSWTVSTPTFSVLLTLGTTDLNKVKLKIKDVNTLNSTSDLHFFKKKRFRK